MAGPRIDADNTIKVVSPDAWQPLATAKGDDLSASVLDAARKTNPVATKQMQYVVGPTYAADTRIKGNLRIFTVSALLEQYKMRLYEILAELESIQSEEVRRAVSLTKLQFEEIEKGYRTQGRTTLGFAAATFFLALGPNYLVNAGWRAAAEAGSKVVPQIGQGVSTFQGAKTAARTSEKDLLIQHLLAVFREMKNKT